MRGCEHPAAVEQTRSAAVGAPQAQAALPRPAPQLRVLSAHDARWNGSLAAGPWDGQRDTRLSCRTPPARAKVRGSRATRKGARRGSRRRGTGGPQGPSPRGPRAPAPPPRGPAVTREQRRVLETWAGGEEKMRRRLRSGSAAHAGKRASWAPYLQTAGPRPPTLGGGGEGG